MLEFEIAAIYYFIADVIKATTYFDEVPEGLLTPCVFYPTPEPAAQPFSTGAFMTQFVMYVKFMDVSTIQAYAMAGVVLQAIMEKRNKIPLVDKSGAMTEKHFKVEMPRVKKVDAGVYQMEIAWNRYTRYEPKDVQKAQEIFMNDRPIGKEDVDVI